MTAVFAVLLAACGGPQFRETQVTTPVVPVGTVINSLKCGLSKALELDKLKRSGIQNAVAVVTLDVNVVQGVNLDGSFSAGIPISGGAGTFTPSFSASNHSTLTNNTTTQFNIEVAGRNSAACNVVNGKYQDAGFSTWLAQVVNDVNGAVGGPPYASMQKYTFDSNFIITRGAKGGVDFNIVPVKLGASFDASRSDVQHINIQIGAVGSKKGMPGGPQWIIVN
ncbi:hypothetical protein QA648_10895 [Rhizobium sp. CB3171]|uniref:hypothetical protein n=1 Tax=Rhizobium sp. CB3171 TaxID=3039157 RepID=UPI0024B24049|nr:hypothetical protein [Rhizobium sp. CB3171]WFU00679.1 hypothetical protein QA648_10895 [Rhizobium sp. CB3171]